MQPGIESLVRSLLHDPLRVQIGLRNSAATAITQKITYVGREEGKLIALR